MKLFIRLFLCATLCAAVTAYAADRTNFSGSYTLTPGKESRKYKKETVKKLAVVQTESSIEVTEMEDGRTNKYRYPLNGQDGIYITPTGLKGTCKGTLRKNDLILESFITTRPDP